ETTKLTPNVNTHSPGENYVER
ncbi:DUF1090 domain-containing protein, partial [Pectobacterium atrosepticum]|nr:DUF1090 domain-containing protein [Pectobacterium atrosepticum]